MTYYNWLVAAAVIFTIAVLGGAMIWKDTTTVRVSVPTQPQAGCACATQAQPVKKYLVFWKEKDADFKASATLFESVEAAWKTVPSGAAEVRIVTVRMD